MSSRNHLIRTLRCFDLLFVVLPYRGTSVLSSTGVFVEKAANKTRVGLTTVARLAVTLIHRYVRFCQVPTTVRVSRVLLTRNSLFHGYRARFRTYWQIFTDLLGNVGCSAGLPGGVGLARGRQRVRLSSCLGSTVKNAPLGHPPMV